MATWAREFTVEKAGFRPLVFRVARSLKSLVGMPAFKTGTLKIGVFPNSYVTDMYKEHKILKTNVVVHGMDCGSLFKLSPA